MTRCAPVPGKCWNCLCRSSRAARSRSTDVERQAGHIDVLLTAELAGTTYKIIVEDKTNTREHSEQLMRYKGGNTEKVSRLHSLRGLLQNRVPVRPLRCPRGEVPVCFPGKDARSSGALCGGKPTAKFLRDYYGYWNTYLGNARRYRELPPAAVGQRPNAPAFSMSCRTVIF